MALLTKTEREINDQPEKFERVVKEYNHFEWYAFIF